MKLSQLLLINAILFVALGIAFALYGPLMIAMFGILESGGSPMTFWYAASFARLFGAALFGFGFALWALRSQTGPSGQSIKVALVISYGLGFVVSITQQSSIWGTLAGWITSAVFLVLLLAYAYLLIKKPNERPIYG